MPIRIWLISKHRGGVGSAVKKCLEFWVVYWPYSHNQYVNFRGAAQIGPLILSQFRGIQPILKRERTLKELLNLVLQNVTIFVP